MRDRTRDLERLADLLVGFGANLQPGQILGITAYYDMADAVRAIARSAYGRGARWVDVFWWDLLVKRARLELAPEDTLEFVPPWTSTPLGSRSRARTRRSSTGSTRLGWATICCRT
jgi:aminopeptidase